MKSTNKLYFLALVPPEPFFTQVLHLKHEVARRFFSRAALNSPPHITLHMPFRFDEQKEKRITDCLEAFACDQQSVAVRQSGFGAFPPRVIYICADLSDELFHLQKNLVRVIRKDLNLDNADYKDRGFHPHITIAFRDLKKPAFREAWDFYRDREIHSEWTAGAIVLLKHDGRKWDMHREFAVQSN